MFILENVPLSAYSTMRLGGPAAYLSDITDRFEIATAVAWADERNLPVIMIGIGSNIVWREEGFPGLVLVNKIMGFDSYEQDTENVYVTVGAGENWDNVVARTVNSGLNGLAELSLIPGTAGATPIQNVGAYGREVKDVLVTLEAYDRDQAKLITMPAGDCGFTYRSSRFKTTDKERFMISAVTFHLTRDLPKPPFYATLEKYFAENSITDFTPGAVREAVIAIRSSKLPNPAVVANNGSFFYNPVVGAYQFAQLIADHPDITYWQVDDDNVKISAAWLLEQAGFKDVHDEATGMATWPKQSLVLVNEHATSTGDLLAFKQKITSAVEAKFDISLQQEPQLLP